MCDPVLQGLRERNRVANPTHSLYVIKPRTRVAARRAGGWHAWNSRTSRRILPPAATVCVAFLREKQRGLVRWHDAPSWQPSRESCHVESSPGDMTVVFYGRGRMTSTSSTATVDPEIEIKYLSIATAFSRSFVLSPLAWSFETLESRV